MRWILFGLSLPTVLVSWFVVVGAVALRLATGLRWEPGLVLTAVWRLETDWSVTVGRGVIYTAREPWAKRLAIQEHEHVHVRQVEDECLKASILGLVVAVWAPWLGAGIWASGGLWIFIHYAASFLRLGRMDRQRVYVGTETEISAYLQAEHYARNR